MPTSSSVLSSPDLSSGVFTDTTPRDVAVSVRGLSKAYTIAHNAEKHTTAGEALMHRLKNPLAKLETETFWALKDVDFDIQKGDVVGIIGRNGAGKSTLLKILSRITEPTTGQIDLYGRVGSLLEVGTGFHPELTGRENVYLNGAILGMAKSEIARQFDAIVDFSGTEQFLDTPVKRYSSGMYVRLAFAVAAHLNPEILIVDEVLAVGDAEFQKKCMGKMQDVAESGRTVLFVSHNTQAISTLTQSCLYLKQGEPKFFGPTEETLGIYLSDGTSSDLVYVNDIPADEPTIRRVEMFTTEGGNAQAHGEPMEVDVEISTPAPIKGARFSIQVLDRRLQRVMYVWYNDTDDTPLCREAGLHTIRCRLPQVRLYMGNYTLRVNLSEHFGGKHFESAEGVCPFEIIMHGKARDGGWSADQGSFIEDAEWGIETSREPQRSPAFIE